MNVIPPPPPPRPKNIKYADNWWVDAYEIIIIHYKNLADTQ